MSVDLTANKEMLDMMVDFLLSAHTGVHWENGKPSTPTEHTLTESKNALIELIENDKKVTIKDTDLTIPNMDPPINMWGKEQTDEQRLKIGIDLKNKEYDILSEASLEAFGVTGGELTKKQKIQVIEDYQKEPEQIANPQDGEGRPDVASPLDTFRFEPEMTDFQKRFQKMNQQGYTAPKRKYLGKTARKMNRQGWGGRNKSKKRRKSRRGRKSRRKSKKSRRKRRRTRRRRR